MARFNIARGVQEVLPGWSRLSHGRWLPMIAALAGALTPDPSPTRGEGPCWMAAIRRMAESGD